MNPDHWQHKFLYPVNKYRNPASVCLCTQTSKSSRWIDLNGVTQSSISISECFYLLFIPKIPREWEIPSVSQDLNKNLLYLTNGYMYHIFSLSHITIFTHLLNSFDCNNLFILQQLLCLRDTAYTFVTIFPLIYHG